MANSLADIQRFVDQNPTLEGLDDESRAGVEELINRGDIRRGGQEASITEKAVGGLETATNFLTSAGANIVGGFLSLGPLVTKGPEAAEDTLREVTDAFTFDPRSAEGQRQGEATAEFLSQKIPFSKIPGQETFGLEFSDMSLGEVIQSGRSFVGDNIRSVFGDTAGAIASGFPDVLLALLPAKGLGKVSKTPSASARQAGVVKILKEARKQKIKAAKKTPKDFIPNAPSIDFLKKASGSFYDEVDALGVRVKPQSFDDFLTKSREIAENLNVDPVLSPKANRVMRRMEQLKGQTLTTKQADKLRRLAQTAARSADPLDQTIGSALIKQVDDLLGTPKNLDVPAGVNPLDVGFKLNSARSLWGQSKRAELIEDAMLIAQESSNVNSALRTQFKKILTNKKTRAGFTDAEKAIIRRVSKGTGKSNLVRMLGGFGFDFSAGGVVGGGFGSIVGGTSGGVPGAILLPFIGTVARPFAEKLIMNDAAFANAIMRAGRNNDKIIAEYIKNVPKAKRNPQDLGSIMKAESAISKKNKTRELVREAAQIAKQKRIRDAEGIGAMTLAAESEIVNQSANREFNQQEQPVGAQQ